MSFRTRTTCPGTVYFQYSTPPHKINEGVPRNGIDPLSEGEFTAVTVQVDIDLDEGLLQQVVGIVRPPEPLHEETVDRIPIAVEQVLESRVVPLERLRNQLPVVGYDIVGYLHTRSSRRTSVRASAAAHSGLSRSYRK